MFAKKRTIIPRFFLALLLMAAFLQAAALLFLSGAPNIAQAKDMEMNLQVPIPTLGGGETNINVKFDGTTKPIAEYIMSVYNYSVGIVGILAAVVMMIGGLMWITAGGNTSNISEAKAMITASLTGLVLVLTSYLILSNVNPALVNLQSSVIGNTGTIQTPGTNSSCSWTAVKEMRKSSGSAQYSVLQTCDEAKNDGKKWDEVKNVCEGEAKEGEICCCPRPTGCENCQNLSAAGFYAPAYACCHDQSLCPVIIPCMANKTLMDKLSEFKKEFTVTGAWPPTPGAHAANSRHNNGTAVDVVPVQGGTDALLNLAGKIKSAGAGFVQYESSRCSELKPYLAGIKCVFNAQSSGEHFHIQN